MTLLEQQQLFAKHTADLFDEIIASGYSFTYGEAMRSQEQAAIYARQGKGIVDSLHCKRLAIDINIFNKNGDYLTDTQDYEQFGKFWECLDYHNVWGGNFSKRKDGNHFQRNEE